MPKIQPLTYVNDSTHIFSAIRDLPFSCWLDSGKPNSHSGRYDVMTAMPNQRWVTMGNSTQHLSYSLGKNHSLVPTLLKTSSEAPLSIIKKASEALIVPSAEKKAPDLPFAGGFIGYFSYDLGREQLEIPQQSPTICQLPDMVVGWYEWAIVQDHHLKTCYLVSLATCEQSILDEVSARLSSPIRYLETESTQAFSIGTLTSNTSAQDYKDKLARIDDYINAGDCYQVNFSQCFSTNYKGDPYIAYKELRQAMASPFSAFMDLGEQAIMSLSPERFLQTQGAQVLTQPIKGTVARHTDQKIDQENAASLLASTKNRAENLMIVDLLRNDLGKNCAPGSISVPALFELKSFPNVHHLVSSITGTISGDQKAIDVFQGCFPGGSITGAPKKRAMEIIEELEKGQRSIYCGSIAYMNEQGDLDSNITIRTIACDGENLYCWGGGGIVSDSDADEEYQESLTKINAILNVLKRFKS